MRETSRSRIYDVASFISSQVECVTEPIVMSTGAAGRQTVWAVFVFVLMLRLLLFLHR